MPCLFFYVGMQTIQDLRALDDMVYHFRGNTFAESTKKTYQTYLRTYIEFCTMFNIRLLPLSQKNLGRYVAFLAKRLQFSSITNYLTIVKLLHSEGGFPDPISNHYIHSILKGAKRVLGNPIRRKLPIRPTPQILRGIFSTLNLGNSFDLCLLAFFSFLRKSNLLSSSVTDFDPSRHLCRQDITFHKDGATICLRKTKTIQFNQRQLAIPLPRIPNPPLCPSCTLLMLSKIVQHQPHPSSVFLYMRNNAVVPLTYPKFLHRLHQSLCALGIDSHNYSGHSFRRGGASFALECGVPGELIQAQGDWKSDAYKAYLDPSLQYRKQVMQKFAQSLR